MDRVVQRNCLVLPRSASFCLEVDAGECSDLLTLDRVGLSEARNEDPVGVAGTRELRVGTVHLDVGRRLERRRIQLSFAHLWHVLTVGS